MNSHDVLQNRIFEFEKTIAAYEAEQVLLKEQLMEYKREQVEVKDLLVEIRHDLSRYKGFVGGVLFVFSAMGAAVALLFQYKAGQ